MILLEKFTHTQSSECVRERERGRFSGWENDERLMHCSFDRVHPLAPDVDEERAAHRAEAAHRGPQLRQ